MALAAVANCAATDGADLPTHLSNHSAGYGPVPTAKTPPRGRKGRAETVSRTHRDVAVTAVQWRGSRSHSSAVARQLHREERT